MTPRAHLNLKRTQTTRMSFLSYTFRKLNSGGTIKEEEALARTGVLSDEER